MTRNHFRLRPLLFLLLAASVSNFSFAASAPSGSPLTEAQKRYLRGDSQRVKRDSDPAQAGDPDQDIQELIQHREEVARKMQQLRKAFDPTKPASGTYVPNIGDHPRMLPFLVLEGLWLLAMILLRAWLSGFTRRRALTHLASLFVLALYLAGAGVGLPLGVFGNVFRQWVQMKYGIAV